MASNKALGQLLKEHGINPTQQRVEIAQILFAREQHLSAEEGLAMANAGQAIVSKATVYNTLGLFTEKGLLREVIVDPTKVFYDSNTQPHQHFYNSDTGEIVDIPQGSVTLENLPDLPDGTEMSGVDIVIRLQQVSKKA